MSWKGANFTVEKLESGADEVTVIVRFADKEEAKEFVRNASMPSEKGKNLIKRANFTYENISQVSHKHPISPSFLVPFFCMCVFLG